MLLATEPALYPVYASLYKKKILLLLHVSKCLPCLHVYQRTMCVPVACVAQKDVGSPRTGVIDVVSHHVGAENQTQRLSLPLSLPLTFSY